MSHLSLVLDEGPLAELDETDRLIEALEPVTAKYRDTKRLRSALGPPPWVGKGVWLLIPRLRPWFRFCIAAGCPEQVCRVCGKARERVVGDVEVESDLTQHSTEHYNTAERYGAGNGGNDGLDKLAAKMRAGIGKGHVGWTDCNCLQEQVSAQAKAGKAMGDHCLSEAVGVYTRRRVEAIINQPPPPTSKYRPGMVLDPFIGSGTVAHVARKLGRHAIGIDLNSSYLELAARRLQQQSLFAEVSAQ